MENQSLNTGNIDAREIIAKTVTVYKKLFSVFIGIALSCAILNEVIGIILDMFNVETLSIAFFLNILITSWASIVIIDVCLCRLNGKAVNIKELAFKSKDKFWRFVAVTTLTLLMVGTGLFLLVIPGLILATLFILADIMMIAENIDMMETFKKSARMIQPQFWSVLPLVLMIMAISSAPGMIVYLSGEKVTQLVLSISKVLSVFIMPFFVIAQVLLYHELTKPSIAS